VKPLCLIVDFNGGEVNVFTFFYHFSFCLLIWLLFLVLPDSQRTYAQPVHLLFFNVPGPGHMVRVTTSDH
jgi:hypothetical protein